jgi:hypothetical protein
MDGYRHVDGPSQRRGPAAANDASFEREIEALLAVDPSPEFLARVRTRVAEEPEPGGWHLSWIVAAATTVAVVAIALIVWRSPEATPSLVLTPSSHAPVEPARVAEAGPVIAPVPAISSQPARTRVAVNTVAPVVEPVRTIAIDLPEVVVGDNEAEAYAALVARIRQSRFDATVPVAPNPDVPLEIKELPPVEPLEIEPIVRVAALQTEGEHP